MLVLILKLNVIMIKIFIFIFVLFVFFVLSCVEDSVDISVVVFSGIGVGGLLACFIIIGDYLYIVDNMILAIFDISVLEVFEKIDEIVVIWGVEIIFLFKDYLLLGI